MARPGSRAGSRAGEVAADQAVTLRLGWPVLATQLGEDDLDLGRCGHRLHAPDDLHRPHRVERVEEQVDLPAAAGLALGPAPVPVPFEAGLHPGPRLGGDVGTPVQDLGDRRHGNADLVRDFRDGDGASVGVWPETRHRRPTDGSESCGNSSIA